MDYTYHQSNLCSVGGNLKLLEGHDYYLKSLYRHNKSDLEALILMNTLYSKGSKEGRIMEELIDLCSKIEEYFVPIVKDIYHIK